MADDRVYRSFAKAFRTGALFDADGRLRILSRGWAWVRATIPLWASELARQLREDLQPVPKPDIAAPVEQLWRERHLLGPITREAWQQFVTLICNGVRAGLRENLRADTALTRTGIPRWLLRAYLRASPELRMRYSAPRLVRRRRRLPIETVMQILNTIRGTDLSTRQAVLACTRGLTLRRPYESLIQRTLREPALAAEYLAAKHAQSLRLREELFEDTDGVTQTAAVAGDKTGVRSAMRRLNKALHRLEGLQPARLRNRQRALEDPRAADLIARRRRAGHARRVRRMAQNKEDRT